MADEDSRDPVPTLGPIPEEMYSEYESRPFKTCTRCGETLFDFREGFRISKVYRKGEVLFEYALCAPCFLGILEESDKQDPFVCSGFNHLGDLLALILEGCRVQIDRYLLGCILSLENTNDRGLGFAGVNLAVEFNYQDEV